jgi:hypothetical protein
MDSESYSSEMNGLKGLLIGGRESTGFGLRRRVPAPWEGDWRLAIAEERVATAQAKLAAAEQRVRELMASTNG